MSNPSALSVTPPRILLVDDRPQNLLAIEAILAPLDCELVRAASGEEALKHLLHNDYALILLDVQMPGLDGFETANLIKQREKTRHIPIIFITAISIERHYVFKGYSAGAVDYLAKPFDPEILVSKARIFIELYCKGQEIKRQAELLRRNEQREKERQLADLEIQLERRRLRELAASEARLSQFKATLDATLDCVFIFDPQTLRFTYANRGALDQLGYTADEIYRLTPCDIQPEYPEPRFRELIQPLLDGTQTSLRFMTSHRHRDGALIPVEVLLQFVPPSTTAATVPELPQEEGRFVAVVRDIGERRKAEAAMLRAKEEAERASQAKSEFISGVSHELRTPLNAIVGFSKLLLNPQIGPLNEDQTAYLTDIADSADHLLALINDILDLSKIEAGKLRLEPAPLNLAELLNDSLTVVREEAHRHNLVLATEIAPEIEALPLIMGDARKIRQILFNLLSNAVKFTSDGGAVTLRAALYENATSAPGQASGSDASPQPEAQAQARAVISVRDTGIGIAESEQERIFGAFEQVDNSHGRHQQGTGLGLGLARHLVELQGGRIWLQSRTGEGSTFSFTLPLSFVPSGAE